MCAAAPEGLPPRWIMKVSRTCPAVPRRGPDEGNPRLLCIHGIWDVDLNHLLQHRTDQIPGDLERLHLALFPVAGDGVREAHEAPERIVPEEGEHRNR